MTAMLARQQLQDGVGLSVALNAQHDAFIGPLHNDLTLHPSRRALRALLRMRQSPHGEERGTAAHLEPWGRVPRTVNPWETPVPWRGSVRDRRPNLPAPSRTERDAPWHRRFRRSLCAPPRRLT